MLFSPPLQEPSRVKTRGSELQSPPCIHRSCEWSHQLWRWRWADQNAWTSHPRIVGRLHAPQCWMQGSQEPSSSSPRWTFLHPRITTSSKHFDLQEMKKRQSLVFGPPCCIGFWSCLRWSEGDQGTWVSSRGGGSLPSRLAPRVYLHHSPSPSPSPMRILSLICVWTWVDVALDSFSFARGEWWPRACWQPLERGARMISRGSPANTPGRSDHCWCIDGSHLLSLPSHSATRSCIYIQENTKKETV